jgi:1,4-alpha-glucan branching enzyme
MWISVSRSRLTIAKVVFKVDAMAVMGLHKSTGDETMSKSPSKKRRVTFSLPAPEAKSVSLAADFTDWEKNAVALKRHKDGVWKATTSLAPGSYEYRFLVDGQWVDDPACTVLRTNIFGGHNCVCEVPPLEP